MCIRDSHYPFDDDACSLQCSDTILQQVFELCKNGVKYGCQDVYTDCPSREKGQYAGDLTVSSASQVYLTGDLRLFKKAVGDQTASQKICPGIMAVTPGSFMQEIADYSLQFPILVLRYYQPVSYTHLDAQLILVITSPPDAKEMTAQGYFSPFRPKTYLANTKHT